MDDRPPSPAVYVDADACPVKAEIVEVATRHRIPVLMVSNGGIRPDTNPLVRMVYVAQGADEADKWIADHCGPRDVVVTGDIPLAAKCVAAGARVMKHSGEMMTEANIGNILAMRDLMADLRAADPFRAGGGKSFGREDRARLRDALDRALRAAR